MAYRKNIQLSIIVPIKVTFQNRFLLKRIKNLAKTFVVFKENIELVLVDSSSKTSKYSKALESLAKEDAFVTYCYLDMLDIYSAAKARNYGVKQARGDYILFYDVDLVVKYDFLIKILEDIYQLKLKASEAFEIYPCLYLSESKTKEIEGKELSNQLFEAIKINYLEGFNEEVLYLAVNTSTILVNREHFLKIGAYDEVYKGHGYEDFELIHRLYLAYPIVPRGDDYIMDFKTPFPMLYRGFRQYFAYYALPNFFKGMYTIHLWHPRPLTKKYYRHREVNLQYFLNHLQNSFTSEIDSKYFDRTIPSTYLKFLESLLEQYGFDNKKYCGLSMLNDVARNQKPKFSIKRKIRRRFLNILDRLR